MEEDNLSRRTAGKGLRQNPDQERRKRLKGKREQLPMRRSPDKARALLAVANTVVGLSSSNARSMIFFAAASAQLSASS